MKGIVITLFLYLLTCLPLISQQQTLKDLDKKTSKTYSKALKCLNKGEQAEGIKKLEQVTSKYPGFAKASERLVGLYMDRGEKDKAIALLRRMEQTNSIPSARTSMTLSYALEEKEQFPEAISTIEKLLSADVLDKKHLPAVEKRLTELKFRMAAYASPVNFNPVKMSSQINTSLIEYHPTFIADGSVMMYVQLGEGKFRNEDLYMAELISQDSFSVGQPIEVLNTDADEGAFSLSQDGKTLIFTACNRKNSIGGCDLYISFRKGDSWSPSRNLGPKINSRYWDASPSLSADGRTIYFSSKRPGGQGGSDIWSVTLSSKNEWSKAQNLGPAINTASNDETPFLHPDNTTLYFVSDGHVGMGSYDIYFSKYIDEEWSEPTNLGYPINTVEREGGIFVDLSGNRAYYSSQIAFNNAEENQTSGDIYYFDLPEPLKPELVTYVKVVIKDAKTQALITASTELISLDTSYRSSNLKTQVNGQLLTTIRPGEYALSISKEGYLFHSENVLLADGASLTEPFVYEVFLRPIEEEVVEVTAPVVLNNIFFEVGSAQLLPRSDGELRKLTELLNSNSELRIKIKGHTDNVGSEVDNKNLSENRAKAVYDRLISEGISAARLGYEGRGEADPIAENDTEAGRQKNRRTEFVIL